MITNEDSIHGVNTPNYPKFVNMFYAAEVTGEYKFFTEEEKLPSFRGIAGFYPAAGAASRPHLNPASRKGMIAAESVTRRF